MIGGTQSSGEMEGQKSELKGNPEAEKVTEAEDGDNGNKTSLIIK